MAPSPGHAQRKKEGGVRERVVQREERGRCSPFPRVGLKRGEKERYGERREKGCHVVAHALMHPYL
jgi:hypothetical protein